MDGSIANISVWYSECCITDFVRNHNWEHGNYGNNTNHQTDKIIYSLQLYIPKCMQYLSNILNAIGDVELFIVLQHLFCHIMLQLKMAPPIVVEACDLWCILVFMCVSVSQMRNFHEMLFITYHVYINVSCCEISYPWEPIHCGKLSEWHYCCSLYEVMRYLNLNWLLEY